MNFLDAVDDALGHAMAQDPSIIIMGEDVPLLRRGLLARFGPRRVLGTPISESAFIGAAVTAAMAGLRPVVELMIVDFLAVAMDALVNQAAKVRTFSGGNWSAPIVLRATAGGGLGDGGQHEQSWWGWLAHIPGIQVVVPSTPAEAGGLLLSALKSEDPTVYLVHKLFDWQWLDFQGIGGRNTVYFKVPKEIESSPVPETWKPIPLGTAQLRRPGTDLSIVTLGMDVYRSLEAADVLQGEGISAEVLDLRSVSPLDQTKIIKCASHTGRVLVVDEDYSAFGLSGEIAALLLEAGLKVKFSRVATQETIPLNIHQAQATLPNTKRIIEAARDVMHT
jgi:pyruvate dehydrogenase E1 component beta subunit